MKSILIISILLLSGCSSYHNFKTDGDNVLGGGFSDKKIHEGLYYIVSRTNFGPWINFSAAHKTFNRRATELCGSSDYKVIEVSERDYEHVEAIGSAQYIISQVKGYVICQPDIMSDAEAQGYIQG